MTETPALSIYEKTFMKSDITDAILVVDGKKMHVNKGLLSIHSDYFNTLFNSKFKEKLMEEIEIKDVIFEELATLLSLIHPNPLKPAESYAEKLLELADRFLLNGAKRHLELIIMTGTKINRLEKLRIADKYKLGDLFDHTLMLYKTHIEFNGFRTNQIFIGFSDNSKAKILNRMMTLLNFT